MRKLLAVIGACVLLVGCAAEASAAGSAQELPSDAVATVDGVPITKADYDHWREINARSEIATGGGPAVPDPPSYTRCIAALRERASRVRGRKAPSKTKLRARCRTHDRRLRQTTMTLLIQAVWLEMEAEALGLELPDAKVKRALRTIKRQSFERERDYRRFLRASGMTEADVLFRLRSGELATAITRHVVRRGSGEDEMRRLVAFTREFQTRWSRQTTCRDGFVIAELCGNAAGRETSPALPHRFYAR